MAEPLSYVTVHRRAVNFALSKNLKYHGFKEFKGSSTRLQFECKGCGFSWDTTKVHKLKTNKGCRTCEARKRYTLTTEEFVEKANTIHKGFYDYSKTVYGVNSHERVIIICPDHGEFKQTANTHISGGGCPLCAKVKRANTKTIPFSDFKDRANIIHNNLYEYVEDSYINVKGYVEIICKEHGVFKQKCFNHLNENQCPKCSCNGFNKGKDSHVYLVVWESDKGSFCKVGITNNAVSKRIKIQARNTDYVPVKIYAWGVIGSTAQRVETEVMSLYNNCVVSKEEFPDGFTETYDISDKESLKSYISLQLGKPVVV